MNYRIRVYEVPKKSCHKDVKPRREYHNPRLAVGRSALATMVGKYTQMHSLPGVSAESATLIRPLLTLGTDVTLHETVLNS